MKVLSQSQMMRVNGGERGTGCGLLVGATIGLLFVNPVAAALVWMVTPAGCALDYAL